MNVDRQVKYNLLLLLKLMSLYCYKKKNLYKDIITTSNFIRFSELKTTVSNIGNILDLIGVLGGWRQISGSICSINAG